MIIFKQSILSSKFFINFLRPSSLGLLPPIGVFEMESPHLQPSIFKRSKRGLEIESGSTVSTSTSVLLLKIFVHFIKALLNSSARITCTCILILSLAINATAKDYKYGKVTIEELTQTACAYYPDAHAESLFSNGTLNFDNGKAILFVHKRVKVYSEEGKGEATVKLNYYAPKSKEGENILNIKAACYNLANGEKTETKMKSSDVFETRLDKNFKEISFVIPNVQIGSVFEYSYRVESRYLRNLPSWQVQDDIPTAYTAFDYTIPQEYLYKVYMTGNVYNADDGTNTKDNWGFNSQGGKFKSEKVAPIYDEPYQPNMTDVYGKKNFQLVKFYPENIDFSSDYFAMVKKLKRSDKMGYLTKKKGILNALEVSTNASTINNAKLIYDALKNKVSFNGYGGLYVQTFGKRLLKEGTGSTPDINVTLIAALNEAEFAAYPIIMSTRGNGIPHPVFADIDRFNYLVAGIKYSEGWVVCDASANLPFGVLPIKCLNNKGMVINKEGGKWINLKEGRQAKADVIIEANLTDELYTEKVTMRWSEYEAYPHIDFLQENGEAKLKKKLMENFDLNLKDLKIENSGFEDPLNITFTYTKKVENDETLYITPVKYEGFTKNPFQRETRHSNIDIPYGFKTKIVYKLKHSNNWELEIPKSKKIIMNDKQSSFTYVTSNRDGAVDVISDFRLMETDFSVQEYPIIKDFFEGVATLNNEVIIAKKIQ